MEVATVTRPGVIGYGPDLKPKLHSIPPDKAVVLLLGLSRSGWSEKEKQFYGFQAFCGELRCNFGLFAGEGFNLLIIINFYPLHARADSVQAHPPRSPTLLLGESLGQLSNVTDLWNGFAHVSIVIANVPRTKKLSKVRYRFLPEC